MSRTEEIELTNMCMVTDRAGHVLVQDRRNPEWPGITFPGGHVEAGEAFADSVVREVLEETGLAIGRPVLCGIKQFPKHGKRYVVLLYRAEAEGGELKSSEEGDVFWVKREDLRSMPLASTFDITLDLYDSGEYHELNYREKEDRWHVEIL